MANVTVLPDDYDGLKKEYLVLRKELDCVKQELYANKRQLKVFEALQLEYQSEIEILQSEENSHRLKQQEKITQLEENISSVKSKCNKQIQALESELSAKEDENEKLKAEIDILKKSDLSQTPADDTYKLLEELTNLKHEYEALLEHQEELKLSVEILQKNCFALEETLTEHREEVTNLKESLSCKRDELMEANDLVQKLNDELFCLKSELETYKNKPLNAESKGNSLFAEVDDRRVYLQKTINTMKSEYIYMKQERAKHLDLISRLRKDNKALCERWKMDVEEKEDDEQTLIDSYKDQIKILGDLVEKYKQDLATKPAVISTGTCDAFEFYQKMLNNKLKEMDELRDQLKSRGLTHILLSKALREANRELRKWRLEATLKQCQLEIQSGDSLSESVLTEKINAAMGQPSTEFEPANMGSPLACKKEEKKVEETAVIKKEDGIIINTGEAVKEIITINDSADDLHIVELESHEDQEHSIKDRDDKSDPGILENKESVMKTEEMEKTEDKDLICIKEEPLCVAGEAQDSEDKENVSEKGARKVTFSQNTVSPKATDRTALRANCRRVMVPTPIYIPSE